MNDNQLFLIAGLGNPGPDYRHNRHNVGFMAVDALAAAQNIPIQRVELRALVGKGTFEGGRLILAKPQTYMNYSGRSVGPLMRYYKIPL
jgi:PTH1 family peptidyl-tRNA hydrolase